MEILLANGTTQRLGLGVPENRCDTKTDGITVKFQQAERDDSARPVPPFPWPYVQLLNSPEELKRLQDIWIETMVIRARRASTPSSNTTNSCDICDELLIPEDSTTVIESCFMPECETNARAHWDCILEVDEEAMKGTWCCGICGVTNANTEDIEY